MRILKPGVAVALGLALHAFALGAAVGATQDPAPAVQAPPPAVEVPKPEARTETPIRGELAEIDTEARTLVVITSAGARITFAYTDDTEISGAKEGMAGLATMSSVQVAVHFKEGPTSTRVATRIEVLPTKIELPPTTS
jgi:hypothetical protein